MGMEVRAAVAAIASAPQVPGRLERVPAKRSFQVFVDYAHTEDALRNVLRTLRELNPNRLITVFGCGGDRDRAKRPLMAAASEELRRLVNPHLRQPPKRGPGADPLRNACRPSSQPARGDSRRTEAIRKAIKWPGRGRHRPHRGQGARNLPGIRRQERFPSMMPPSPAAPLKRGGWRSKRTTKRRMRTKGTRRHVLSPVDGNVEGALSDGRSDSHEIADMCGGVLPRGRPVANGPTDFKGHVAR